MRGDRIKLTCETCRKEYEIHPGLLVHPQTGTKRQFCSKGCYHRSRIGKPSPKKGKRVTLACKACGVEFEAQLGETKPNAYRKGVRQFCSRACRGIGQRGESNPSYTNGTHRGYKKSHDGFEHILVAERALGRKLAKGEVVHHIDGDKTNNRNDNLLICTPGYHAWIHQRMSMLYAQEHFRRSM